MNVNDIFSQLTEFAVTYGVKLVGAVLVWIIGSWIIKAIRNGFGKMMDKREVDESLKPFLKSLFGMLLKVLLALSVLSMLGRGNDLICGDYRSGRTGHRHGPFGHLAKLCRRRDDPAFQAFQSR